MALILHISDLHLVSRAASPALDDHKVGLVPAGSRFTHFEMLRLTLKRLGERLIADGKSLDAIVVTGDIANRNDEGGYVAFLELLDVLGLARPGPDRIVVVPGNHDVTAGLEPGDPHRYDRFVRFIRGAGFVTPVLNGVDQERPRPIQTSSISRWRSDYPYQFCCLFTGMPRRGNPGRDLGQCGIGARE